MLTFDKAIELVGKLDRTRNYPRDPEGAGVDNLARGLQKASDTLNVAGARIVERCAETSEWCPTDADLMTTAREIARLDGVVARTYDVTAGAGNNAHASEDRPPCARCQNSGWEAIYTLHTARFGDWRKAKREDIAVEEYDRMSRSAAWPNATQRLYSGARRCTECRGFVRVIVGGEK